MNPINKKHISYKAIAYRMVNNLKEDIEIQKFNDIEIVKVETINNNILWIQLLLHDSDVLPIKVDLLKNIFKPSTKNIYLSPGSGLNIEANFITPKNDNLATFLVNKDYLVIGVTPREDAATLDFNFELMKDWGLTKHTDDFKKVISLFQQVITKDYEVLGHSAGALVALNYASNPIKDDGKLKAARIIDIIGQYPPDSQEFQNAQASFDAANQLINQGIFADTEILGFEFLAQQAKVDPNGDSGFPRPVQTGGNFTNQGLFFFSLIFTNSLPGTLTDITGLPSDWYFKQGFLSGTYNFGPTPQEDTFNLSHTATDTIFTAIGNLGSGIYPLAYDRDFFAIWKGAFPIVWENIKVPVFYINTELGFGEASFTIGLLKNATVISDVIRDYGHADPVFSETADTDFWNKLFP